MKRLAEQESSPHAAKKIKPPLQFDLAVRCYGEVWLFDSDLQEIKRLKDPCQGGRGIAVGEEGELYLGCHGEGIGVVSPEGNLIKYINNGRRSWSIHYDNDTGGILVPNGQESKDVCFYGPSGQLPGTVGDLACFEYAVLDKKKRLVTGGYNELQVLGENGGELYRLSRTRSESINHMAVICGIAIDKNNNILVADHVGGYITVLSEDFKSERIVSLTFMPRDLAVDPFSDNVFVADYNHGRVVVLESQSLKELSSFRAPGSHGLAFHPRTWREWKPGKTKCNVPINALIKAWHLSRGEAESPLGMLSRDSVFHELIPFLYNTVPQ